MLWLVAMNMFVMYTVYIFTILDKFFFLYTILNYGQVGVFCHVSRIGTSGSIQHLSQSIAAWWTVETLCIVNHWIDWQGPITPCQAICLHPTSDLQAFINCTDIGHPRCFEMILDKPWFTTGCGYMLLWQVFSRTMYFLKTKKSGRNSELRQKKK